MPHFILSFCWELFLCFCHTRWNGIFTSFRQDSYSFLFDMFETKWYHIERVINASTLQQFDKCVLPQWTRDPNILLGKIYDSLLRQDYLNFIFLCILMKNRYQLKFANKAFCERMTSWILGVTHDAMIKNLRSWNDLKKCIRYFAHRLVIYDLKYFALDFVF